jgi:hypothetical protein
MRLNFSILIYKFTYNLTENFTAYLTFYELKLENNNKQALRNQVYYHKP